MHDLKCSKLIVDDSFLEDEPCIISISVIMQREYV